jgi:hypothetical protein
MTVPEIHKLLTARMTQLAFMMNVGVMPGSLQKFRAIEILRNVLNSIAHCSLNVHYRWLLKHRIEVIDILPGEDSKYKTQRKQILSLLQEAERTINAGHRQRILVR